MKFSLYHRLFYRLAWSFFLSFFKIWLGIRYLHWRRVPNTGPVLIVGNHESFLDPPAVAVGIVRMCHFMARESLFSTKTVPRRMFSWLMHHLNAFPVSLDGSGLDGVKQTLKLLKAGESVVIFPEGTRSEGDLLPFHKGFISVAKRGKAAIVPCGLYGARKAMPRGAKMPRMSRVAIAYGEVISAEDVQRMSEEELLKLTEEKVRELIAEAKEKC